MIGRWHWVFSQVTKRLWFRATLFSVLGVFTALVAAAFKDYIPQSLSTSVGADAVDKILGIIASSMLAVTTFSLSTMVTAYGAASSGVTPRATTLVMEDATTQNALATFIGSFLFSLVGIVALSTGVYGSQGRVLLFAVTIAVIVVIVYTLLRWIDHLSRLGRVSETIDRVESATITALKARIEWPCLGALPFPATVPNGMSALVAKEVGYVQHIDIMSLQKMAEEFDIGLYIEVVPGSFVSLKEPVVWIDSRAGRALDDDCASSILSAFTMGVRRTFEHDPRFGLSVLSEIASRALSPAVNDPGTAIDVIGRGVRAFSYLGNVEPKQSGSVGKCERVFMPTLDLEDMFADFFTPIARDGAALVEVEIRLLKALASLKRLNADYFSVVVAEHAQLIIQRAQHAKILDCDLTRLQALALASGLYPQNQGEV
jgi:uncharacterized membrane protein